MRRYGVMENFKMQTRVAMTLAFGFFMGLGLASCASMQSGRSVAGDSRPQFANSKTVKEEKIACQVGEERGDDGECRRAYEFDRPFRRGGR